MKKISAANLGMHILEVEITTRCNLNCKHCYNRDFKNIDLPLKNIIELYRFANKYDVWTFILSGGEALLHPQFDRILRFIKSTPHNFRLVLQTNGQLFDETLFEKLRAFDLIHISCDLVEDVRIGGYKNFSLAKKLLDRGIKCYLFSTIYKTNRYLIGDMIKKAKAARVPIGFNICLPVNKLNPSYLMTKDEFLETEKELYSRYLKGEILRYSSPLTALLGQRKKGRGKIRGGCSAGVGACLITSTGELFPCPFLRVSAGNIFDKPLKELWLKSKLLNQIRDRKKFMEPCGSCERLSYCGGCRNRALVKTGDIQGADPMCYKNLI